jgi:hypothetical protein
MELLLFKTVLKSEMNVGVGDDENRSKRVAENEYPRGWRRPGARG